MLKANSKKALANLWAYIRETTEDHFKDCEYWADVDKKPFEFDFNSNTGLANFIWDYEFMTQYGHEVERVYRGIYKTRTLYNVFFDWSQGLPCGGLFDYHLHTAKNIVAEILEETKEETGRFTEEQAADFLTTLIFNQVQKNRKGGII